MNDQDPTLLVVFMLAALLLGLMIAPRSKQADEAYAQAYAEYREALETNEDFPWPHRP